MKKLKNIKKLVAEGKNLLLKGNETYFIWFLSLCVMYFSKVNVDFYRSIQTKNEKPVSVLGEVFAASEGFKDINFYYDSSGQRIAKIDEMGDHTYYISPDLEVVIDSEGRVNWRKNYYFAGKLVAVRNGNDIPEPTPTIAPTATPYPTPTPSGNLLKNGSFEYGSTDWKLTGGSSVVYGNASDGSYSGKTCSGTGECGFEQVASFQGGYIKHTIKAWVKADPGGTVRLGVRNVEYPGQDEVVDSISNQYTEVILTVFSSAVSSSPTIYCGKSSLTSIGGYCDNLSLIRY